MINLSKKIELKSSSKQLYILVSKALELMLKVFEGTNISFWNVIFKIKNLHESRTDLGYDEVLQEWYWYITYKHGDNHRTQTRRHELYFGTLTKSDTDRSKTVFKLIFVYLHKNRAAVLTHDFTRPTGSITALPEMQKLFYAETIIPFLDIETTSRKTSTATKTSYKSVQRLWQTGIKSLLMSDWFSAEGINTKDLQALRYAQLRNKRNEIIPLPVQQICEVLCREFPFRINSDVTRWLEYGKKLRNSIGVEHETKEAFLKQTLEKSSSPLEITMELANYRKFGVTSFAAPSIHEYNITKHIFQNLKFYSTSLRIWSDAEEAFSLYQNPGSPRKLRFALGKINLYLFIYLPLWFSANPSTKFKYPTTPAQFTSNVHYDCDAPLSADRPLSLCELFRALDYVEHNGSQTGIRAFFTYLTQFGSELEGCTGVTQPVRRVTPSKKYGTVTKNVFTGVQLRHFISYHNALHSASEYFFENSTHIHAVIEKAKRESQLVETEDLGFVPIMVHEGKITYIRRLHPDTFLFVMHDHAPYYNPASFIFSLFLLECGVRGQTLQWLDAKTYDRISQRLARDSLQLTTLWLNTDKIHKIPVIIVTTMGNLWLLDDQRQWREYMIDVVGISGFRNKVFYNHEPKSHWGLIQPLFPADPITGSPITDETYSNLWTLHCLNFQMWFKENTAEKNPIVGFLPLKKNSTKSYFTWENWIDKIDPADVMVVQGSDSNRVYQGDYCPIAMRAYSTPHGARASFITDMSINLPPEAVALLTGQSLSTIIKYNKGHHLLKDRLQGAFNNRDASWYLTSTFEHVFSMADARDIIEDSVRRDTFAKTVEKLGLNSFPTSNSPREMTGLKLIATDRSLRLGACYTHICPYNFICPESIVIKFGGQKRCSQCPFAVFSTHNLPAIEAHRQKVAEDYLSTVKVIEKYKSSRDVHTAEISRLQQEIKDSAKDVIRWMLVEEVLWASLEMQKEQGELASSKDLLIVDNHTVLHELSRSDYKRDSVEGFLSRLDSACTHPESLSRSFEYKIDRATRLLMINDGKTLEAATMPSSFPSAVKLAGMLRSTLEFKDIDLDQFVRLINLEDKQWTQALLSYRPSKDSDNQTS
ncbi:hypothetical protein SOX05_06265 [Pseudomonas putida]|nr:hypothetical protein [Pseudomonas putida]MDY4318876.1 hypothetical protein [Pseudomonas putida]MDY4352261.1 hypothetical protein [Pseudomonas putida]